MSDKNHDAMVSLKFRKQAEAVFTKFEQSWQSGPNIAEFLSNLRGTERLWLLRELIVLDLECRSQRGEDIGIEDYVERFSDEVDIVESAFDHYRAMKTECEETHVVTGDNSTNIDESPIGTKERYFGDYELLDVIARGGMGVVYKARQMKLRRNVALKMILSGQLASKQEVQRFYTEAQAAANLDHPGIVPIFEVGQHNGQHFFSMALVEGESLAEKLRDGPLPPREAAELVKTVATAVHYAHEKGVIHRDLKPSNILLKKNGVAGVANRESENNGSPGSAPCVYPMVTDFGLAKRIHSDGDLTATGQVLGTPSYLPPEQAAGRIDQVRETADVYSLGAVLYAALTGRPPFQADNPVESLRQVLELEPVSPRRLNPSVDKNLETICLRCLRKDPGSRYSSAQELAADLQRTLRNEPIKARPVSRVEKTWLWCRRKPVVAAAVTATVAAILLIAIIATSIVTAQQNANARRIARERKENDLKRAESLVENTLTAPAGGLPYAIQVLDPLREYAIPILQKKFADEATVPEHRLHGAIALAEFGYVEHEFLVTSIGKATLGECANIVAALHHARNSAIKLLREHAKEATLKQDWSHKYRLATVALQLGDSSIAQDMCQLRPDPIQRTTLIDMLPRWPGNLTELAKVARDIDDGPLRSVIALAVGSISVDQTTRDVTQAWQPILSDWYENKHDTGTHSAAGWALRNWDLELPEITTSKKPANGMNWHVNSLGMTMLKIPAGSFVRKDTSNSLPDDFIKQTVTLTRSILLEDREVTRTMFQQFIDDPDCPAVEKPKDWKGAYVKVSPTEQHPVQQVNWYDAVLFCNWLSRKEGLAACYERTGEKDKDDSGVESKFDAWELIPETSGYRLPTEAEWEYACRAGTVTLFRHGDDESLLDRFAVFLSNRMEIPGTKLPNGWGLFDMYGNASEWCNDWYVPFGSEATVTDPLGPAQGSRRVLRGGSFGSFAILMARRSKFNPDERSHMLGFRVAKTYP